jgi:histidinol-phosphate aminotransferase
MLVSRRNLLRRIGAGATGAAIQSLSGFSMGMEFQASRSSRSGGPVRLNRNENAYGPSERVMAAMREALPFTNRFPDADSGALLSRLARLHAVKPEQVILGCGSTEVLRMVAAAFLGAGKKLVLASPTFEAIAQYARAAGAEIVDVPLDKQYAHDLNAMLERAGTSAGLVYICNPNNPTGSITTRKDLEIFLQKLPATTHVVIDEAYHHYYIAGSSAYRSFIDHPVDDPRVIVTRTFSKIYGLAGIRIGYALAAPQTAGRISAGRLLDGVNVVAARAAMAALDDAEYTRTSAQRNADDRQEFFNQANARMLRAIDSHTNFVMLNTGRPAGEVVEHFRKNNLIVAGGYPSMGKYIRVSLGKPEDMQEFWRIWDLLPPNRMSM